MRVPGPPGLRLHVSKAHSGGRIGDANEMLARGTLDLASGKLRFALQRLVAVRTIKLKFFGTHKFFPIQNARKRPEKYRMILFILLVREMRM